MGNPRAIVIPYPAQGHVIPLLELSHCLVERGFRITFVNSDYSHKQITTSLLAEKVGQDDDQSIEMVAFSDGLSPEKHHSFDELCESMLATMPGQLEELIMRMLKEGRGRTQGCNSRGRVTCVVVADSAMGWAVEVAEKVGVPAVAVWTAPASLAALVEKIPVLIESEVMDANGTVARHQMIKLSETMPPMNTRDFIWLRLPEQTQHKLFHYLVNSFISARKAKYLLCNSFHEIEPAAIELLHDILLPVGPLLPASHPGRAVGHFWPEDDSCLDWLNEQDTCSVVYVAFGSVTMLDQRQFHELALGLDLSGRPFLWAVRPNLVDGSNGGYPEGFLARVAGRGKMVSWAPQQKVLAHPSIACFMSHCGWNSTMEGVAQGVPFLCWPYIADQFFNATTVCDVWKTGVRLAIGEGEVVTREEVKDKVALVMSDVEMRARAMKLRDAAWLNISPGGTSKINFDKLIEEIIG